MNKSGDTFPPGCEEALLTVDEIAARLKVRKSWIYTKTREGAIPMIRVGKHVRFFYPAVIAWLQDQGGQGR